MANSNASQQAQLRGHEKPPSGGTTPQKSPHPGGPHDEPMTKVYPAKGNN